MPGTRAAPPGDAGDADCSPGRLPDSDSSGDGEDTAAGSAATAAAAACAAACTAVAACTADAASWLYMPSKHTPGVAGGKCVALTTDGVWERDVGTLAAAAAHGSPVVASSGPPTVAAAAAATAAAAAADVTVVDEAEEERLSDGDARGKPPPGASGDAAKGDTASGDMVSGDCEERRRPGSTARGRSTSGGPPGMPAWLPSGSAPVVAPSAAHTATPLLPERHRLGGGGRQCVWRRPRRGDTLPEARQDGRRGAREVLLDAIDDRLGPRVRAAALRRDAAAATVDTAAGADPPAAAAQDGRQLRVGGR